MIQGNDCLFQVLIGDDYQTVLCAKSININTEAGMKETTTKGDGRYQTFDYDTLTARATLEGLLGMQNETNPVIFDFNAFQNQFMEVNFRVIMTEKGTGLLGADKVKVFRGMGMVRNINWNASAAQLADGTVELLVSGEYFLEDAIPEYIQLQLTAGSADPDAAGRFKIRFFDDLDNLVYTTENYDEAVLGWMVLEPGGGINITKRFVKGTYRVEVITEVNSDGNVIAILHPLSTIRVFATGNQTTEIDDVDFEVDSQIDIGLGTAVPPPACVDVLIVGSPDLPNGAEGSPYTYSFAISGTAPFTLSNVTKPAWLTIAIVGNAVQFNGTPDAGATGVEVSFDITNCATGSANFTDTFDIEAIVDPIDINYNWPGGNLGRVFRIYVNGVLTREFNGVATEGEGAEFGSFVVAAGAVVESTVSGIVLSTKKLRVKEVDGATLYESSSTATRSFTFTAEDGKDYLIEAQYT